MKIGKTFAVGLLGLSLAAIAPHAASAMTSESSFPPEATVSTANAKQVAFDENTDEHQERQEQVEHGRERTDEFTHRDSAAEHIDTHNLVRDHTPGTDAHEQHERHEGEEQHHTSHQSDGGY